MRCSRTRPGPIDATAPRVYLLTGERSPPIPLVKVRECPQRKYLGRIEMPHHVFTPSTMRTSLTRSWESRWGQDELSIANNVCIEESGRHFSCAPTTCHRFLGSHWRGSLDNLGKLATKTRAQMEVRGRTWLLLIVRIESAEEEGILTGFMGLSASEGAPICGGPVRRRFAARERSDMSCYGCGQRQGVGWTTCA
jgi:hypothetical protein